jgi:hypothetical protein
MRAVAPQNQCEQAVRFWTLDLKRFRDYVRTSSNGVDHD